MIDPVAEEDVGIKGVCCLEKIVFFVSGKVRADSDFVSVVEVFDFGEVSFFVDIGSWGLIVVM